MVLELLHILLNHDVATALDAHFKVWAFVMHENLRVQLLIGRIFIVESFLVLADQMGLDFVEAILFFHVFRASCASVYGVRFQQTNKKHCT